MVLSEAGLQAATTMAIALVDGYWRLTQAGGMIHVFQSVYALFQVGIFLLYALRNHSTTVRDSSLEEGARRALHLLPDLFLELSLRWPAAADTGHYVKLLRDTVLHSLDSVESPARSPYDLNLLAELDFIITQRRIHSVFHRNVDIIPEQGTSPEVFLWDQTDHFEAISQEMWQEILDIDFDFLADNTILSETPREEQTTPMHSFGLVQESKEQGPVSDFAIDTDVLMNAVPAYVYSLYERYQAALRLDHQHRSGAIEHDTALPLQYGLNSNVFVPTSEFGTIYANLASSQPGIHQSKNLDRCFYGRSSSLSYLLRGLTTKSESMLTLPAQGPLAWQAQPPELQTPSEPAVPPVAVTSALSHVFTSSVNVFYPTLKGPHLDRIMSNLYRDQINRRGTWDRGLGYLVLAIGSKLGAGANIGITHTPEIYYAKALQLLQGRRHNWRALDQLSLLQRTLLICLYLLLDPASGDIWRYLGFAIRIYFDLSHRPAEDDDMDEELLSMLSKTLYCLECDVSIAFGRPSSLVIGDKVRDNIIKPRTGSVEERIATYFYRLSLFKMQIHSHILSNTSAPDIGTATHDHFQALRAQLEAWLKDWTEEGLFMSTDETYANDPHSLQVLEAWANLNYHHTLLLMSSLPSALVESPMESCVHIAKSCTFLARHQQRSIALWRSMPGQSQFLFFPKNWTTAHLILKAGLQLSCWSPESSLIGETMGIMNRCLTALALFEGDPSNLSTGFSEILEHIGSAQSSGGGDVPFIIHAIPLNRGL
ncbi:uncharacterized protein JN550_007297 [Neoarthrinium moseri]|uniref:uncharacterized protein n=1 Tax=Neoarthrinium moseri TaxID=1658444 RepID=UPI001FDB6ACC|nr:uncharacterized protein JN550_007297 [Neoarthrinium moseri]KAI1867245.1 hypothetical protein JN550_007297 [Neoarthrinium moseri]